QYLDISQTEPMVHVIADLFARGGRDKPANSDPLMAPHDVFPCAGEDEWIAIAVETDAQWQGLCRVLASPDLAADAGLGNAAGRRAAALHLADRLAGLTVEHHAAELAKRLQSAGVPAA